MTSPSMTLGIELELICTYPKFAFSQPDTQCIGEPEGHETDSDVSHFKAGQAIYAALNADGVPATGYEPDDVPGPASEYSRWRIDTDVVQLSSQELDSLPVGWLEESIEIASPVMSLANTNWQHQLRAVLTVLDRIKSRYGCVFLTNSSTGLHVHIGHGKGVSPPVRLVKRVFQLATAFESRIDQIHAASRVLAPALDDTAPFNTDSEYILYAPLSFFHHEYAAANSLPIGNVFDHFQRVEALTSLPQIGSYFRTNRSTSGQSTNGHSSVVNFDNLFADEEACRPDWAVIHTIEFRQHIGTLDFLDIIAWVHMLGKLVTHCHRVSDAELMTLLTRSAHEQFLLADFLAAINCNAALVKHLTRNEEETLGVLPHPLARQLANSDPLRDLTDFNDTEQTTNYEIVQERINIKYQTESYSLRPQAGSLDVSYAQMHWMLRCAFADTGNADAGVARMDVWRRLSWVYAGMDRVSGNKDERIALAVEDWKRKYGLPQR